MELGALYSMVMRWRENWVENYFECLCGDFYRSNLALDLGFLLIAHDSQIKLGLKIEPKTGSSSDYITEPQRHLRRDTALLLDDIVDGGSRYVQSQCQLISVQAHPLHKL